MMTQYFQPFISREVSQIKRRVSQKKDDQDWIP
jgi:hypothetical protein